jgi:hypothetical protein
MIEKAKKYPSNGEQHENRLENIRLLKLEYLHVILQGR